MPTLAKNLTIQFPSIPHHGPSYMHEILKRLRRAKAKECMIGFIVGFKVGLGS